MRKSVPSKTEAAEDDELLTVEEVCARAKCHRATFYSWLADPRLSLREIVVRLPGGRIRVQWSRFVAWLEANARGPAKPTPLRGTGS